MVGLVKSYVEITDLLKDLRSVNCELVTIGQYLAPSDKHFPVQRFYAPEEFAELEELAYSLGFKSVASGPLVRSSFHSQELLEKCTM